jgi:hypothetical protein
MPNKIQKDVDIPETCRVYYKIKNSVFEKEVF